MKFAEKLNHVISALLTVLIVLTSSSALAQGKSKKGGKSSRDSVEETSTETEEVRIQMKRSAPEFEKPPTNARKGLGWATTSEFLHTQSAISFSWGLNDRQSLQFLGSIDGYRPFNFGAGVQFKHSVVGDWESGFHIGMGMAGGMAGAGDYSTIRMGNAQTSVSYFYGRAAVLLGGHVTVARNLLIQFEGGPNLTLYQKKLDSRITAMSDLLGLSAHYLF